MLNLRLWVEWAGWKRSDLHSRIRAWALEMTE